MEPATFDKLEFHTIREVIAEQCASGLGKSLALSMEPATKTEMVRRWLDQVDGMMRVTEDAPYPPMGGVYDVRGYIRASGFPAPLEPESLAEIADTLAATIYLRQWFAAHVPAENPLAHLHERIDDLSPIATAIGESVDAKGRVRDHASPRLANIRRTIDDAQARIRKAFDGLLRKSSTTRMLQYAGTTFHNDRMVLPLKAEYRGRIDGIIHRTSDSGATLFVEPGESVELNNSIVRLRDEERKEITQILKNLTQRVYVNRDEITSTLRAVGLLDLIAAKSKYAKKRDAICPIISDDGVLDLHEARHPVLVELFAPEAEEAGDQPNAPSHEGESEAREVVPIDIRVGDDFDVLVITGPNTGGKTVAMKTTGALALMTQCGIPIPAAKGSIMPVFKSVFVDIGDEQSIRQSLSTFSSHLSHQLEVLQKTGSRTLVLIDELGAGTDPDEGAAIGRSIIDELLRLGSRAIITTHLSALKAVAYTTDRVDNASVEFDVETLSPTYRVRLGEPGNSNAIVIAKRLGMPQRMVNIAKSCLDDSSRALNKAIEGTLTSRREAETARKEARLATVEADETRKKLERHREELQAQQEQFDRWSQWIDKLKPGDPVFVKTLQREATVVRMQLHKQTALVSSGAMDIEVSLRDLSENPEETSDIPTDKW